MGITIRLTLRSKVKSWANMRLSHALRYGEEIATIQEITGSRTTSELSPWHGLTPSPSKVQPQTYTRTLTFQPSCPGKLTMIVPTKHIKVRQGPIQPTPAYNSALRAG